MGVRCSLCGRGFRTPQGRRGHLNFYHGLAKDTPFTKAIRWTINRNKEGVKKLEEEQIKNRTKREERREKAMDVLRKYERSMAETDDRSEVRDNRTTRRSFDLDAEVEEPKSTTRRFDLDEEGNVRDNRSTKRCFDLDVGVEKFEW